MKDNYQTLDDFLQEETQRDPAFAAALTEVHHDDQLGAELAMMRERQGLTQRELAERAGISQPMLNRIERGNQTPKISTLWKILRALQAYLHLDPLRDEISVAPSNAIPAPDVRLGAPVLPGPQPQ